VDAKRLHIDITAIIRVMVDSSERYPEFVENAMALEEVLEVHSVTGEGSHILKVRTASTTTLERLLSTIQSWRGVHGTTTSIVLSTFKESRTVAAVPVTLDAGEPVPA
jgi:Lrp/AsnC family leucine-responsive transcriptional regulator